MKQFEVGKIYKGTDGIEIEVTKRTKKTITFKYTKPNWTEKDFPKKIRGNDGQEATFKELQPLGDGEFAGVYRYPRGESVHFLEEIKEEDIIER